MPAVLSQFNLTHLRREDGRWSVAGSGLYTHCPDVYISAETAERIIGEAEDSGLLRCDYDRGNGKRVVGIAFAQNALHSLLSPGETAALKAALAEPVQAVRTIVPARRHNTGASKANSFRHLRQGGRA